MKKINYCNKIIISLVIITLFMSIGYASVNSITMDIEGKASSKEQNGVYITDVVYSSDVNANKDESNIINAYQTVLNSNIVLSSSDENSSITYKVEVYNSSDEDYYFYDTNYLEDDNTYSNDNIIYELSGITKDEIIKSKEIKNFYITFKYKDDVLDSNSLTSYINFIFKKRYTITYENFNSVTNLPSYIYEGEKLELSFENVTNPIEVSINNKVLSSNDYTYSNNKLVINSVTGNIKIRVLKKYTITNLVTNGSFENGLNSWSIQGGNSTTWLSTNISCFGSKGIYRVAPSSATKNYITQSISWKINHKYYYFAYAISTAYQPFVCDVTNKGGSFSIQVGPERFSKGSSIYTSTFTGTNTISINYAEITVNVIVDGVGVIDLTENFGAGNEPSLTWCNDNIDYFDGSTSIYK